MAEAPANALDLFRQEAELTRAELWWRYFELGGMSDSFHLDAFLQGALQPTAHDRDVIAHALNERFAEQGGDHPVPYSAQP